MLNVLKTLGVTSLALAALVYIARQIVLHIFTRDLAVHKTNLDREMQQHAHNLNCLLQQFQIQYSKTYERQVDAIRKIYDCVRDILKQIGSVEMTIRIREVFDNKDNPEEIRARISCINEKLQKLKTLHDDEDIYLPTVVSDKIARFIESIEVPSPFESFWRDRATEDEVKKWRQLWIEKKPQAVQLMSELKVEFRRLQGIDTLGRHETTPA